MRVVFVAVAGMLSLVGCKRSDDKAEAVKPSFVKAHTMKQLMAVVAQPQADVFWKSAGSVSDATGAHDLRPTTDEAWLRTQSAAATLTELGNLMQTPLYAEGRGQDWIQFSRAMSEIGIKAEKAARERASEDVIFDIGGTMYNVCTACHQIYPPAAGEVSTGKADAKAAS